MSRKMRVLLPVAVVLLLMGLCILSLATIDSAFVTRQIAAQIEESAEAKTEIQRAEIRPFAGEVRLEGVTITKEDKGTHFRFVTDHIDAKVSVEKLIVRQLDFLKVHVEKPAVTIVRTDREIPKGENLPTLADLLPTRIKKLASRSPKKDEEDRPFDFVIQDLTIEDGSFAYKETRGKVQSLVELKKLKYHATDVSISRFYRLLVGANIEGDLRAGGFKGTFRKFHSPGASTVSFTNLDMRSLNTGFLPIDAIVIKSGVMDVTADLLADGNTMVTVKVSGLEIERNPNSRRKTFFLLPVKDLVKYVNRKGGNFDLALKLSGAGWHTSEDLDELIAGFMKDFWMSIMQDGMTGFANWLHEKLSR
ncbi:MAG: hypothetical protein GXP25_19150 [Planctomycetes bacterium]|nr:hypothetical protein [Planctomycetota bacterium]